MKKKKEGKMEKIIKIKFKNKCWVLSQILFLIISAVFVSSLAYLVQGDVTPIIQNYDFSDYISSTSCGGCFQFETGSYGMSAWFGYNGDCNDLQGQQLFPFSPGYFHPCYNSPRRLRPVLRGVIIDGYTTRPLMNYQQATWPNPPTSDFIVQEGMFCGETVDLIFDKMTGGLSKILKFSVASDLSGCDFLGLQNTYYDNIEEDQWCSGDVCNFGGFQMPNHPTILLNDTYNFKLPLSGHDYGVRCQKYKVKILASAGDWTPIGEYVLQQKSENEFSYSWKGGDNTFNITTTTDGAGRLQEIHVFGEDLSANNGGLKYQLWCINPSQIFYDEDEQACIADYGSNAWNPDAPGERKCCGDDPEDFGYYDEASDKYCGQDGWEENACQTRFSGDYSQSISDNACCGDDGLVFNFESQEDFNKLYVDEYHQSANFHSVEILDGVLKTKTKQGSHPSAFWRSLYSIPVNILQGKVYILKGDVKIEQGTITQGKVSIRAQWLDQQGDLVTDSSTQDLTEQHAGNWIHLEKRIDTSNIQNFNNVVYAKLVLATYNISDNTTIYWDNVSLFPAGDYGFISSDDQFVCYYPFSDDNPWNWLNAGQERFKIYNFANTVDVASNGDAWYVCDATGRGLLGNDEDHRLEEFETLPVNPDSPEAQGCVNLSECGIDFLEKVGDYSFSQGACKYKVDGVLVDSGQLCECLSEGVRSDTCSRANIDQEKYECLQSLGVGFYCTGSSGGYNPGGGGDNNPLLGDCQGLNVEGCLGFQSGQYSCDYVQGVVCNDDEVCTGYFYEATDSDRCCVFGNCIEAIQDEDNCTDKGYQVCESPRQYCDGSYQELSENTVCCFGNCLDTPNPESHAKDIICYKQHNNDLFGECCGIETECFNHDETSLSIDKPVFSQGSSFNAIESFDYFSDGGLKIAVGKRQISCGDNGCLTLIAIKDFDTTGFESIAFSFAAPDVLQNFGVGLRTSSGEEYDIDKTLADYSTTGVNALRWHRIVIPLKDFKEGNNNLKDNQTVNTLKINYSGSKSITVLIDNIEALPSQENTISTSYYCAGYSWISDLDNASYGKYACNSIAGFGWTGSYCCGDDTTINSGKEFFNDSLAGCWAGVPVPNNVLVGYALNNQSLNDVLFFDNNFWVCDPEENKEHQYPYNQTIWYDPTNTDDRLIPYDNFVPAFTVKGFWFCSNEGVWKRFKELPAQAILAAYLLNISNSSSPEDYALYCDVAGLSLNNVGGLPQGLLQKSFCVASLKSENNRSLIVGLVAGNTSNVSSFINSLNNYYPFLNLDASACDDAPSTPSLESFFFKCVDDNDFTLLYNKPTGIAIIEFNYGRQTFIQQVLGFFRTVWDAFINFVKELFGVNIPPHPIEGMPIKINIDPSLASFEKLYIAKSDARSIKGVLELVNNEYDMTIVYNGFESNNLSRIAALTGVNYNPPNNLYYTSPQPFDDKWNLLTGALRIS